MFQFSAFASLRIVHLQCTGFPHSDMYGSFDICSSPYLFAAYHVLLRLSEPRHPPCALSNLSISSFFLQYYYLQSIPICQWTSPSWTWWLSDFRTLRIDDLITKLFLVSNPLQDSWRITDSNRWPPACKAGALASWANPPFHSLSVR